MPNDGDSANLSPTDNNDESKSQKFTAVNNNNNGHNNNSGSGNSSTVVMSHRAQLPPIIPAQGPRNGGSNASASTLNSPRHGEDHWQQGNRPGSDVDMTGTSQKRKRSPEILNQRAVTPTTQITHHHLAAHEAAMAEEHSGSAHNINQHRHQSSLGPEDHTGSYSVDEDMKGNDDGRERAGTQEGSPQPGAAQGDPKKRKRIFSNRTKTGCITCRRRKKKCDEGKPECLFTIPTFDYQGRLFNFNFLLSPPPKFLRRNLPQECPIFRRPLNPTHNLCCETDGGNHRQQLQTWRFCM